MKKSLLLMIGIFSVLLIYGQKFELRSPDGFLNAVIDINQGINVTLNKAGKTVIKFGNISLETKINTGLNQQLKVQKAIRISVNEIIRPQIREKAETMTNSYNELEIRFKSGKSITFRCFSEGLAYRLSTSSKDSLTIYRENLSVDFEADDSARFQSSPTFNSCWETPYEHLNISGIEPGKLCNIPFLVEKRKGPFVMITEADLFDYPGLWLIGTGKSQLTSVNPPYPKTLSYNGSIFIMARWRRGRST
jgi:alpha-glucosidase